MANSDTVMLVIRSSRPQFRNNRDKIAFVVHASFIASGYKLVATGRPAFAEDALSSSPSQGEVGIEGWNEFEEYAFVYAKKGSKKILVKCLAIDDKLLVDAIAEGGKEEPAHLEIEVGNYVAESREEGDYDAEFKNLGKLVTDLQNQILYKVAEGLKPVPPPRTQSSSETNEERESGYCVRRPVPLGPQIHPSGLVVPPIPGPGYSDLIPGPGAGVYPVRGGFGDGSMLVGPNDPRMFPGVGDHQPGFMGPPQPGVPPPGARYDPIGPGFEPGRLGRQPPRRPGDIHPDLEHFPRGFGSDYI
ncbi:PREDICTED: probable proteasome inhibitor [Brassica oleracea var. oleracea]|uniref:PI31 proteasome regulator N-terminal domain-containing protein n=1 Tax=Brassica oleracea var. oleracea TaxID=109376 RepID=A0A0D3CTQ1_BRAOL|nr:PREDICTED: probable proteasome inhibitor [Brassica oleracea var. oleracea]